MTRARSPVASRKRRKKMQKLAKGFWGDRRNHISQTRTAVMKALVFNYAHRKDKKGQFRSLWIQRINVAARLHGLSYSKMINGLAKAGVEINRKMLSEMAIHDPAGFGTVAEKAKAALVA